MLWSFVGPFLGLFGICYFGTRFELFAPCFGSFWVDFGPGFSRFPGFEILGPRIALISRFVDFAPFWTIFGRFWTIFGHFLEGYREIGNQKERLISRISDL